MECLTLTNFSSMYFVPMTFDFFTLNTTCSIVASLNIPSKLKYIPSLNLKLYLVTFDLCFFTFFCNRPSSYPHYNDPILLTYSYIQYLLLQGHQNLYSMLALFSFHQNLNLSSLY